MVSCRIPISSFTKTVVFEQNKVATATPTWKDLVSRRCLSTTSILEVLRLELICSSGSNELVTILVGKEKKPFAIHKEVASYSPVLKAAFNSDFLEGQTQTYILEDASVGGFQLVTQWLYRQAFKSLFTKEELDKMAALPVNCPLPRDEQHRIFARQSHLVDAYEVGDYLQLPRLQNLILDEIEELRLRWGSLLIGSLHYLYERRPQGDGLRELAFEECRRFIDAEVFLLENEVLFPKEFLLDCVKADRINRGQVDPFTDRNEFKRRFHVSEE